jgi:hypothetical protein
VCGVFGCPVAAELHSAALAIYVQNTIRYTIGKNKGVMMATVKTAISLNNRLLEQVDSAAQEMNIPRSRLFVLAVEAFLRQRENERLLKAINKAYDEHPPDERELVQLREMQHLYVSALEDEAW